MNDVGARIHNHKHSLISALEDDRISEDEFWQKIQSEGAPLLESDLKSPQHTFVTYLCKIQNSDEHVVVHPGGFADPPTNVLYKIPGTNTCYACYRYSNDVRLHYTFAFNMPPFGRGCVKSRDFQTRMG